MNSRRLLRLAALVLVAGSALAAGDAPLNTDDPAFLRRQHVWLRGQPAERQAQLRRLNDEFERLPTDDQAHLTRALQNYNAWLAKLSEADRQRVTEAPTKADRLTVVRELREKEWIATRPKPYRDEYAKLDGEARRQKVREWRLEEGERKEEWAVAQKNWMDYQPGQLPKVLQNDGLANVDRFVENLKPALSEDERKRLEQAKAEAPFYGYYWYVAGVANLAEAHPLLPGKVGPKDWASLSPEVVTHLAKHERFFKKVGITVATVREEPKELRRASGRWPDFAIELTRYCHRMGLNDLPPLGDCKEADLPPEAREAIGKLKNKLQSSPEGRTQYESLAKQQGKWPEYPKQLMDLCRKAGVPVTGWTLPGPPAVWDKLRSGKAKSK